MNDNLGNVAAERTYLSGVLVAGQLNGARLAARDFADGKNRRVFAAMLRLTSAGKPLEAPAIRYDLAERDELDRAGGAEYLAHLLTESLRGTNLDYYERIILGCSRRRDIVALAKAIAHAEADGDAQASARLVDDLTRLCSDEATELIVSMADVEARRPEYLAGGLVRARGLHLWWGPPGFYKTYCAIRLALEMTQRKAGELLFDLDGFEILRPWRKVLWLGDEESASEWKSRAEILARGHGLRSPGAEIVFADASGGALLSTDDLPKLVEAAGADVDAVFVDPLANLVPLTDDEGRPAKADVDNAHALGRVCRPLRRLAKQRDLAVVLLHHPNAAGQRERGPSAYRGSADVVVEVQLEAGLLSLVDHKNRDRARGRLTFRPEWSEGPDGLTLRLDPADAPGESSLRGMTPTARAMLAAVTAGAGSLSHSELMRTPFHTGPRGREVSLRTKQRAWQCLVEAGLVTEDDGVIRLLDPRDEDA